MKKTYLSLMGVALALSVAVLTANAQSPQYADTVSRDAAPAPKAILTNLTKIGNTVAAGNAACPDQPFYLYSGGKNDTFVAPADPAYLSPDLATHLVGSLGGIVAYDVPMDNGRWGDSFNLQNTRGVCYVVIKFRTKGTGDIPDNDALVIGHVQPGGSPMDLVGEILNIPAKTGIQSYALDATGLSLLSQQTGYSLDKTAEQSILDMYIEDDSMIDFMQVYVWYGPNCSQDGTC